MRRVQLPMTSDLKPLIGLALLVGLTGCPPASVRDRSDASGGRSEWTNRFTPQLEAALDKRLQMVERLAAQSEVVATVRQANERQSAVSESEMVVLEQRWAEASPHDPWIKSRMMNPCAEQLFAFQDRHHGFPEIFVTDARGQVIAQTNKTSDYIQSDEIWWQLAYSDGWGRSCRGTLVYDDSAISESISFNVPILDPDSGRAIGVLKAVCDITDIKLEM